MMTKITNARIVTEDGILENKNIYIRDGVIEAVTEEGLPYSRVIDADGLYLSAGFIDLHVHGALNVDFTDGTAEEIVKAVNFHCKHGTTTIFPTTLAAAYDVTTNALRELKEAIVSGEILPHVGGIHMEGPYFSKAQCGAQNKNYITPPIEKEYKYILDTYGDIIARWSFAPELEGTKEFMDVLKEYQVVPSLGHTDAKYQDVMMAYENGCRLITHFFSCTSTITREKGFRVLGVTECGYLLKEMMVEAIADGCHVPKELFRMLYQIKGSDNICLVTDAIRLAGSESETGLSGGIPCKIKNGVACLMDESAFAGSIATTDRLVRFCVKDVGLDLCEAVKMATVNPARIMGLKKTGCIAEGYEADFVLFNDEIEVKRVFVAGEEV